MTRRRAFILPVALAMAAIIAATVIFCAGLLRKGLAEPERAVANARAQALFGLDAALAQLQAVAAEDTTATTNAGAVGSSTNAGWTGVWMKGNSAPVWLVSGENPNTLMTQGVKVTQDLRAPEVMLPTGSYAYAVEDLSQKVTLKSDRLPQIAPGFGESLQRLRQQTIFAPVTTGLAQEKLTPISYGLLTNPVSGGFKTDLDAANENDELATRVGRWRSTTDLIRGRPIIWAEAAILCGIYKNSLNIPQLGLAFWADAWNPYTLMLPFNGKDLPDLRLRLEGPFGTVKYLNSSGALVGFERIDLAAHTSASPIMTDLYGPMNPGEIRFITHYRLMPISTADYPDAVTAQIEIPAGEWNFVFETLEGQPVQKITGIPFDGFTKTVDYNFISEENFNSNTCQWVMSFKLREPMTQMMAAVDPRAAEIKYRSNYYASDSNPVHAQTNFSSFSGGDTYRGGQFSILFDLPEGSLPSVGSLYSLAQDGAPALSLGSLPAGSANSVFDKYFFSSVPASANVWQEWTPNAGLTLPNANLRLAGTPEFAVLKENPAQHLLLQGAFNINTADTQEWLALLPTDRYPFPFRTDLVAQPVAIPEAERQAWAQALVARLKAKAQPWRSLEELASENILPPDVFCRVSALLQPRGDTFAVHVVAKAGNASSALQALVQRLPTTNGNGRRFQVLSISWQTPPEN